MKSHMGWVVSTNFAEGLPYAVITTLSVVMMADMGLPNSTVTWLTSLLTIPWSLKAIWSPVVGLTLRHRADMYGLKLWMWSAQLLLAVCLGGVALSLLSAHWLVWCSLSFMIGAFASATYDVACDGYYMQALSRDEQSFYVGFRSTAYRLSMIFSSGVLTTLVGLLSRVNGGNLTTSWVWVIASVSVMLMLFALGHRLWLRDGYPTHEGRGDDSKADSPVLKNLFMAFVTFVRKPGLWFILLFLLFYRLGEALLSKMTILFLKAPVSAGGLGLDNAEYGLLYGTIGVGALTIGGIWGGMLVSRYGLKRTVIPLALALNLPDLFYVWMSLSQPESRWLIGALVGIEQLGYGLGFTAYMVYMLQASQGTFSTSHYAFLTALMSIGMILPSMLSGWLQEMLGYTQFFWVTVFCTIPGIVLSILLYKRCETAESSTITATESV